MFFQVFADESLISPPLTTCGNMQEFSGIDTVILYSTTIFGFAGFEQSILATASVGSKSDPSLFAYPPYRLLTIALFS
jgi:hypothetical protein